MKYSNKSKWLLLAVALLAVGCSKKQKEDESVATNTTPTEDTNVMGDSDSGKAMGLQTINFAYDAFALDSRAKGVLKNNIDILSKNGSVKIQVEGHCDTRGGIQYNIALGEKRAGAVKKYLEEGGISGDRVTTISYGKERLVDSSDTEGAHAKNRRANFVITSK